MSNPTMPRVMPREVERKLTTVLSFRSTPTPIEIYDTVREALVAAASRSGEASPEPLEGEHPDDG